MDEEEINYRVLRKIQQLEKNSPVLTDIKTSFYTSVSEYLKNLDTRYEKEEDSQKKTLLKDEIQNTRKIVTNIYEQREKKILLASISKARGGNPDVKNMLSSEESLFESILKSMERSRDVILENKRCNIEENIQEKTEEEETKEESVDDKIEPLHAIYFRSCLKPIRHLIDSKRHQVRLFYDSIPVRYVKEDEIRKFCCPSKAFLNINAPDVIYSLFFGN